MEPIKGTSRDGDFVHQSQTMAKGEGFRNVSKLWYDQTISYDKGLSLIEEGYSQREDIMCPLRHMQPIINGDGKFALAYEDGREFSLNDWAIKQFATKCYVPHTVVNDLTNDKLKPNESIDFSRDDKDIGLLVAYFKNGLRHHDSDPKRRDKEYLFRTYKDGTVRAVLTEKYSAVDNRWYIQVLRELLPGGRLSHWRGDADTIYGNILIPDTIRQEDDSEYGGMLSISNCEIGKRRLSQYPSVFRAICMNGCIWGQTHGQKLSKVHKGINLKSLAKEIINNVHKQIPLLHDGLDKLLNTRSDIFKVNTKDVKVIQVIAELAREERFTPGQAVQVAEQYNRHEKENKSLFGIINSITRAGQLFDNDTWVRFDEVAGKLVTLSPKGWNAIQSRAAGLDDEAFHKVFGIKAAAV